MNRQHQNTSFLLLLIIIVLSALLIEDWVAPFITPPEFSEPPSPTPTVSRPEVSLADIQAVVNQLTMDYLTVVEIPNARISGETRQIMGLNETIAKQDMIMLIYSQVNVGFRGQDLSDQALWVDGARVQLVLPAPEIFNITLDNAQTHLLISDRTSLTVRYNLNLGDEIRQIIDDAIRQQIISAKGLEQTARHSKRYLETYLQALGFTEVQVIVQ